MKELRTTFSQHRTDHWTGLADKLVFIDEMGMHLGLTRLYGRAAPGERVVEASAGYSSAHYTAVAALRARGVQAPFILEGSMDSLAFETYVAQVLAPVLGPGDIVILDNLSFHKHDPIRTLIQACGASVEFLPPYSPDFNPIENCWSKAKAFLRAAKARTYDELVNALADALRAVSGHDALAWFAHCGYAVNTSG